MPDDSDIKDEFGYPQWIREWKHAVDMKIGQLITKNDELEKKQQADIDSLKDSMTTLTQGNVLKQRLDAIEKKIEEYLQIDEERCEECTKSIDKRFTPLEESNNSLVADVHKIEKDYEEWLTAWGDEGFPDKYSSILKKVWKDSHNIKKKIEHIFHRDIQPHIWTREELELHEITHASIKDSLEDLQKDRDVAKKLINAQMGWDKEYKKRIEDLEQEQHIQSLEGHVSDAQEQNQKLTSVLKRIIESEVKEIEKYRNPNHIMVARRKVLREELEKLKGLIKEGSDGNRDVVSEVSNMDSRTVDAPERIARPTRHTEEPCQNCYYYGLPIRLDLAFSCSDCKKEEYKHFKEKEPSQTADTYNCSVCGKKLIKKDLCELFYCEEHFEWFETGETETYGIPGYDDHDIKIPKKYSDLINLWKEWYRDELKKELKAGFVKDLDKIKWYINNVQGEGIIEELKEKYSSKEETDDND